MVFTKIVLFAIFACIAQGQCRYMENGEEKVKGKPVLNITITSTLNLGKDQNYTRVKETGITISFRNGPVKDLNSIFEVMNGKINYFQEQPSLEVETQNSLSSLQRGKEGLPLVCYVTENITITVGSRRPKEIDVNVVGKVWSNMKPRNITEYVTYSGN